MSYVEVEYQMSERHACRLMGLGRSTHRYRARKSERDSELRTRLKELAARRMRFGYRRLTAMLQREGMAANHKRVYRLYCEEGLAMRIRQRRRIRWNGVVTSPAATRPNERWSMDFVSDCVSTGKVIRMLTIVDDCTRECPAIEVDTCAGWTASCAGCSIRSRDQRGLPEAVGFSTIDRISRPGTRGLEPPERGVRLEFVHPVSPYKHLRRKLQRWRLRDECLNPNSFTSLSDARRKIESWRQDYNEQHAAQFVELLAAGRVHVQQRRSGMRKLERAS